MVDNFEKIIELVNFESSDDYYYLQVLQRSKDTKLVQSNHRLLRSYAITSKDYFKQKYPEIKKLCDQFSARAYVHLTKRSYKKTSLCMLEHLAKRIASNEGPGIQKLFDSASGQTYNKENKTYLIDIDEKIDHRSINDIIVWTERNCNPVGPKFVAMLETKSGYHIIMKPFDIQHFKEKYPDYDVHKNNPTLLYCNVDT